MPRLRMERTMKKEKIRSGWKRGWPIGLAMFLWMEVWPMAKAGEFDLFLFLTGAVLWGVGSLFIGLWVNYLLARQRR